MALHAKLSTTPQATTVATTTVTLSPVALATAKARCEEALALASQIRDLDARAKRCKAEVEQIFVDEGQGAALLDGVAIDSYKAKIVIGTSTTLDKKRLLELGVDMDVIEAATVTKSNRPYVRVQKVGATDDE